MTKKKGSYQAHQNLIKKFKLAAQSQFPEMRFFDQHVGGFVPYAEIKKLQLKPYITKSDVTKLRPKKIGTKGMPDVFALYPFNNQLIYISLEFKTGNARQSLDQVRWQKLVTSMGGIYLVVRDVDTAIDKLTGLLDIAP